MNQEGQASREGQASDEASSSDPGEPALLASLAQVFEELSPRIRRFLFSLGATDVEADEVVSITFESYLNFLVRNSEGVRNVEAYLITIARNAFARLKRAAQDHYSVEQDHVVPAQPFHDMLVTELEHTLLGGALQRLSSEDRHILTLRLLANRTSEEVAEELGITVVNAWARLSRARRALRTEYLILYAASSAGTSCERFVRPLAKFVAHDTESPPRRLSKHLDECASCTKVLQELRDEAGTGRRARAIIWGTIGLVSLQLLSPASQDRAQATHQLILYRTLIALGVALTLILGAAQLFGPASLNGSGPAQHTDEEEPWTHPTNGGPERLWLSVYPETTRLKMPAPGHTIQWDLGARNDSLLSSFQVQLQVATKDQDLSKMLHLTVATPTRVIIDSTPLAALQGDGQPLGLLGPGEELSLHATLARADNDDDPERMAALAFNFSTSTVSEGSEGQSYGEKHRPAGTHPIDALILALTGFPLGGTLAVLAAASILVGGGALLRQRARLQRQRNQPLNDKSRDAKLRHLEKAVHGVSDLA